MAARKTTKSRKRAPARKQAPKTLWYAGLGAFSLTRKRYEDALKRYVGDGTQVRALAERTVADARKQIVALWKPIKRNASKQAFALGAAAEQGIGRLRSALGIPSKADVEELSRRVAMLSRQLKSAK